MGLSAGPVGFFDLSRRYEGLDKKDPLVTFAGVVPWETLRSKLRAALIQPGLRRATAERKSAAGRKPGDAVLIFKALGVQPLYNLSDKQMEHQLRDRLSFMRFLGLGLEGAAPDATTLWLYCEALAKAGVVKQLSDTFDGCSCRVKTDSPADMVLIGAVTWHGARERAGGRTRRGHTWCV